MNNEIAKHLDELFNKARLFEKRNQISNALKTYLDLLKIYPNHASALNNAAAIFAQYYSNYKNSLECYNRALRSNSKNVESVIGKGSVMVMLGNPADAIAYYKKALLLDPRNLDALRGLSSIYLKINQFENALEPLDGILNIQPNDIGALSNKGIILTERGYYDDAIKLFDIALDAEPANEMVIHNKAYAEFMKKHNKIGKAL